MAQADVTDQSARRGRRGGGRAQRGAERASASIEQLPWGVPLNHDNPVEPLPPEGVQAIHDAAMRILKEIGIWFLHEDAKKILKDAGANVDPNSDRVRMDEDFVMAHVAKAPEEFVITPRNPAHAVPIGGKHMAFVNVSSPPNSSNLDRGRRAGCREDFQDLMKLSQSFNCIHLMGGYPVEPVDIHASVRHLDCIYDKTILTDKVLHAYCLGKERVEDAMEMVRIGCGISHEEFDAAPRMYTNINSSSPLKHDTPMLDGAMRMARRGQPVFVTPFTLSGAMAPVTLAGALAQQTAEGLAAIVLLQIVNPGTPVIMGSFTSNVDMKSGAPAFGTPEYMRATQISGQMARFYGIPMRASNACAANCPDAQAAWESSQSLWAVTTGRANVVYHAAGWLEGGLCASYEKFVMDCETLQQVMSYMKPIGTTPDDLAVETIAEVGPDGHFFGCQHTQDRYQTAFYAPFLSDWRNFEAWEEAGAIRTPERANKIWKEILANFEAPPIDVAIKEELEAFVARRKEEGGAPTDF